MLSPLIITFTNTASRGTSPFYLLSPAKPQSRDCFNESLYPPGTAPTAESSGRFACRLQSNHQPPLRRLLDRQSGGLGGLQASVHEIGDAPVALRAVRPVVHESTTLYSFSVGIDRW